METTPDTLNYMIAGYIAFAVIMSSYLASLLMRWRNLKHEMDALDEIAKK